MDMKKISLVTSLLFRLGLTASGQDSSKNWSSEFKLQVYNQIVLPGIFEILAEKSCHFRNIQQLSYDSKKHLLITGGATAVKGFRVSDTGFGQVFSFGPYKAHHDLVKFFPDNKRFIIGSYGGFSIHTADITKFIYIYKFDTPDKWACDAFFDSAGNAVIVDWHGYAYYYAEKFNKVTRVFEYNGQHKDYMRSNVPVEEALTCLYGKHIGLPHAIISRGAVYGFRLSDDLSAVTFPVYESGRNFMVVWNTQTDTIQSYFELPCNYISAFDIGYQSGEAVIYFGSDSSLYCFSAKSGIIRKYNLHLNGQIISSIELTDSGQVFLGTEDRDAATKPRLLLLRPVL